MGENHMRENPIGVFDSGVCGLTVAREIINQLPNENIVYFGDTARVHMEANQRKRLLVILGKLRSFCGRKR